ncbi:MAG TPA: hypothetical protein VJX74_05520 [Blastocatellia bacterium]|nr:hypothetical protein [Blastocatellia bacterium]
MLPLFLDNIHYYKMDGKFSFSGDLIITPKIIYYFPHTDLEQERINRGSEVEPGFFGSEALGNFFKNALTNFGLIQPINRPKSWKTVMWKWGDPVEVLQSRLDALIAELKHSARHNPEFTSSLPIPCRFMTNVVKQMNIDKDGVLSFEADYDRHDLNIGNEKKRDVQEALLEGEFAVNIL